MPSSLTQFPSSTGSAHRTRAAALQKAFAGAQTRALGWFDPAFSLPDALVSAMCAALDEREVAVATISGWGRTVTLLGVPTAPRLEASGQSGDVRTVLYAPAGLAVFHRERVLSVGGIDTTLVEGHEDANLGWRLALRGLRTVEVVNSAALTSVERPALSVARLAEATRLRHETANQLATLFVCAGDRWLREALPAAFARIICLAAHDAGLRPEDFDFGTPIPADTSLPVETVARLLALDDFIRHSAALKRRRAAEQAARRIPDEEIRRLIPLDPVDSLWLESAGNGAHALCRMLKSGSAPVAVPANIHPPPPIKNMLVPRVSIIVLTTLGPTHLRDCLGSLAALDYPTDAIEVIVVDNASDEDPASVVAQYYPGARVVRNPRNLGFCGGNNAGVAVASHEWLFFLNDDTRVNPDMLRAAFDTVERRRTAAVGALVLDWSGTQVDFAGGGINFDGHGFQDGVGSHDVARWQHERPIAFANGAAMLVHRDAYRKAGGFPDRYFAYYEDVALGWALWMDGHQVWLSPKAIVFHKHHGTTDGSSQSSRHRNIERNACFTVLTHSSSDALSDLLSAGLLLAAERVVVNMGLGGNAEDTLALVRDHKLPVSVRLHPKLYLEHLRAELRHRGASRYRGVMGSVKEVGWRGLAAACLSLYQLAWSGGRRAHPVGETIEVQSQWAATLAGVAECCRDAGQMESRRAALQASRLSDEGAFASTFPEHWLGIVPVVPVRQAEYNRAHRAVVELFELGRFKRAVPERRADQF